MMFYVKRNELGMNLCCLIVTVVLQGCKESSTIQSRIHSSTEENLAYFTTRPVRSDSNPVAVYSQYAKDFEQHNYSHWEIIYDDGTRTQTLVSEGEQHFVRLKHKRMYQEWYKLQEELWEGEPPSECREQQDSRWKQYLENFYYTYVWVPSYEKVSSGINIYEISTQRVETLASGNLAYVHPLGSLEHSHWKIKFQDSVVAQVVPMGLGEAWLMNVRRTADLASMHLDEINVRGEEYGLGYGHSQVSNELKNE